MWLKALVLLIVLFIFWKLYKSVLIPYLLLQRYRIKIKNSKYRAIDYGFLPFGSNIMLEIFKDQKKYDDAFYKAKHAYQLGQPGPMYDFSIANFGNRILLTVRNPELIKEIYNQDGTDFLEKQPQFIKNIKRAAGHSITFSEGQRWKKKRKMMTTLLNFQYILSKHPKIVEIVERSINLFRNNKDKFDVYLLQILENVTSSVIIELFFGGGKTKAQDLEIDGIKLGKYARVLMEDIGQQSIHPFALMFGQDYTKWGLRSKDRQVTKKINKFRQYVGNFVKNRIYEIKNKKDDGQEIQQDYIEKVYNSTSEQERNTEEFIADLIDDFSTIFIAGADTTSHTALMMIYYCAMYPNVLTKLREQISEFIKEDTDLNYENIKKMKYLQCIFHEVTRFYQPANGILIREVKKPFYIGDILLEQTTFLMIDSFSNHYYHENFENPLEFNPDKWMNEDGKEWYPRPYTHLTFSAGPRSCIGKQLAQLQMKTMTVSIFKQYNVTMETTNLRMKLENITYQPQKMKVKFEKI